MTTAPTEDRGFFGHPRGLGFLAGTEMWERFSYNGMSALLMLYMTKYLLTPQIEGKVVGLVAFRAAVSSGVGPMTDLAFAAQTFGLYAGLMLVAPLLGAWLGDRVLGRTRTVTLGALLMAAGHLTMAIEQAFLVALALLILGGGCLLANLVAQIGRLYAPEDTRRTRGFGIYLVAVNVGAIAAPFVAGTLGERVGWHWGFGAAGIGMLIGLATYLAGRRHYPPDLRATRTERAARPKLNRADWTSIGAILLLLPPKLLANAACQQAYGIMLVWADKAVDRRIFGWEMPVTWVLAADGFLTIAGVLFANWLWARLARDGREPIDVSKIGIGNVILVAGFFVIAGLATLARVPILGWLAFYFVIGFSYAWWDVPTRSLIARYAPSSVTGTMFAVSSLSAALGFFLLGFLGRFYEPLGPALYFTLTAMLPVAGAVMMLAFAKPITHLLGSSERGEIARASPLESRALPA